jgi:hypothetical protein
MPQFAPGFIAHLLPWLPLLPHTGPAGTQNALDKHADLWLELLVVLALQVGRELASSLHTCTAVP